MSMPASTNPGSAAAEPGFCFFAAARFFAEFPAFRLSAERSGGAAVRHPALCARRPGQADAPP
ncbi:hypothetical protein, partial [Burkholderia pseudomallei]|uniref:hypothetical protein n=1 Tax=Burkholderia pseudomallei TaxID=28450 RepID=UPI001E445C75